MKKKVKMVHVCVYLSYIIEPDPFQQVGADVILTLFFRIML
jgi:hypothetical protein